MVALATVADVVPDDELCVVAGPAELLVDPALQPATVSAAAAKLAAAHILLRIAYLHLPHE
jgi:hypothetical protein